MKKIINGFFIILELSAVIVVLYVWLAVLRRVESSAFTHGYNIGRMVGWQECQTGKQDVRPPKSTIKRTKGTTP